MPMVRFEPTAEQREIVAALAAAKKPQEVIAAAVINPRTGRQISVKVLCKLFKDDLNSRVGLQVKAYRNLNTALDKEESWATRYVFDHISEFKQMEKDSTTPDAVKTEIKNINVLFKDAPAAADGAIPEGRPTVEHKPADTLPRLLPHLQEDDNALRLATL